MYDIHSPACANKGSEEEEDGYLENMEQYRTSNVI